MSDDVPRPVLYLVGFAAPPVLQIRGLVAAAQRRGWDTCLILTPTAARWLDAELRSLVEVTGHPVRTAYKLPGEPDVLPPADAMLAAPVTFNSVNKWAAGISDTLALGLISEAIGKGLRIAAVPSMNGAQQRHPAYARNVAVLRDAGVSMILDDDDDGCALTLADPDDPASFPWEFVLDTLGPVGSKVVGWTG